MRFCAGVIVVVAAGNSNKDANGFTPAGIAVAVTVSATDLNNRKAPYSNFGSSVDVAAPGGDTTADSNGDGYVDGVLSTIADDDGDLFYEFYDGTSMAAPHVAGVMALMKAVNPSLTPNDFDLVLAGTHPSTSIRITTDLGASGYDQTFGHGLIDALGAVNDGFIDDVGEALGGYPTFLDPAFIEVTEDVSGIDFAASYDLRLLSSGR